MVAPWIINRRSFEVMYGGEFHVIFLVRNGVESVRTVLDFRGTGSVAVIGEKCGDVMFFFSSLYISDLTEIPEPNARLTGITVGVV